MMRSLWTSASGMTAQQMNVDTIANNLSNVNTTGFKKERVEFKSLLYETMQKSNVDENGIGRPVSLQVGHGAKTVATTMNFSQGNIEQTDNNLDFAIKGKGFFTVRGYNGEEYYTRDGSLKISVVGDEWMLSTSDGYPVLDQDDEPIMFDNTLDLNKIEIGNDGSFRYVNSDGEVEDLGVSFKIVQFTNPLGLEKMGNNLLTRTAASGEPLLEADEDELVKSNILGKSLEYSNVQVVEEMVKLIVAQRSYEYSSKAIQASDEMLQQANQLKR